MLYRTLLSSLFFFFNDTATTEIYTLSLHDALPILIPQCEPSASVRVQLALEVVPRGKGGSAASPHSSVTGFEQIDRKSTRLNSSHGYISYAVFCLKKKKLTTPLPAKACTTIVRQPS